MTILLLLIKQQRQHTNNSQWQIILQVEFQLKEQSREYTKNFLGECKSQRILSEKSKMKGKEREEKREFIEIIRKIFK